MSVKMNKNSEKIPIEVSKNSEEITGMNYLSHVPVEIEVKNEDCNDLDPTTRVDLAIEASDRVGLVENKEVYFRKYLRAAEIVDGYEKKSFPLELFYRNQNIFITGGTGFLGKFLIRKLLEVSPDINCIYVLMRAKNKMIEQRELELLFDPVLEDIRLEYPEIREKIIGIPGDCTKTCLGLSQANIKFLTENVSIVFHLAGTALLNKKLREATKLDCRSTIEIESLCKKMKHLRSLVYVSSAHMHCDTEVVDENYHPHITNYGQLSEYLSSLQESAIDAITPSLISPWQNTYTYSKAMAEELMNGIGKKLPAGIFRIGMLSPSASEPHPGFCERNDGIIKLMTYVMQGYLRVLRADGRKIANLVPVDLAANALVTCAHDVALFHDPAINNREDRHVFIYNCVSTVDAPITWYEFHKYFVKYINEYPFSQSVWHCIFNLAKYELIYKLYTLILHRLAAIITDIIFYLDYKETSNRAKVQEAEGFAQDFSVYALNEWKYKNDNTQAMWNIALQKEKLLCNFTMKDFNWEDYVSNCVQGVRKHVLKDSPATVIDSRRRCAVFRTSYVVMLTFLYIFINMVGWNFPL